MLPATQTKHLSTLDITFNASSFSLTQSNAPVSNGTTAWIGGQVLAGYCAITASKSSSKGNLTVIELGSGVGLTALALATLGYNVLATDVQVVLSTVLAGNVTRNRQELPLTGGRIDCKELDWTVPPDQWTWTQESAAAAPKSNLDSLVAHNFSPPFDLIVTADTIYSPNLIQPLLRSLHALALQSWAPDAKHSSPVLICLERRDPLLTDEAIRSAKEDWGFTVTRIPSTKIRRAVEKGLKLEWDVNHWEGVELWKLRLTRNGNLQTTV